MAQETLTNVSAPSSLANVLAETTAQPVEAQKPVEPVKPDPKEEDMSRRFAALSRQQKKLMEEQQRFKQEAKEWNEWKKSKDQAKQNPLDYLKAAGLTPDDLVNHLINDGQPTLEQQVKALQEKLEGEEKRKQSEEQARLEAQEKEQEKKVIDDFKQKITEFINQDTDKYEAIAALKVQDQVWEIINANFQETGELMPIHEAAEQLENQIIEGAKTLLKLKKLGLGQEPPQTNTPQSPKENLTAPTLTNKIAQASQSSAPQKTVWNREESLKKAAQALQWTD
jgi:hypothetical protein